MSLEYAVQYWALVMKNWKEAKEGTEAWRKSAMRKDLTKMNLFIHIKTHGKVSFSKNCENV